MNFRKLDFRGMLTPVAALAAAIITLNLISWFMGEAPISTLFRAAAGSWGTPYGIGQVLFKATPLLFAGIAVDLGLRAGLFNIGVEGQIAVGTLAASFLAIHLPASLPSVIVIPIVLLVAALFGGGWAAIAAGMRNRFGAHEVITTIMLNRIAEALVAVIVTTWLALPGSVRTADIIPSARIPRLESIFGSFGGSASSLACVFAVAVLFGVYGWLKKTRSGRQTVWIGQNERACAAEGINVPRRRLFAFALSGAIAAFVVSGTVLGYKGYYEIGLGAGVGFGGIAVAFLGRGNPIGLLLAALLFGTLEQAGLAINATIPKEAMGILEAVVILAVALSDRFAQQDALRAKPVSTVAS